MTDDERKAVEWMDSWLREHTGPPNREAGRTLKAMLAEPRLPAELSDELVEAIWWACDGHKHREVAEKIVNEIRSHLTKPATKEVEVESWATINRRGHVVGQFDTQQEAQRSRINSDVAVVRLTGKATVPA